jgi:hypothetical protein
LLGSRGRLRSRPAATSINPATAPVPGSCGMTARFPDDWQNWRRRVTSDRRREPPSLSGELRALVVLRCGHAAEEMQGYAGATAAAVAPAVAAVAAAEQPAAAKTRTKKVPFPGRSTRHQKVKM